MTAYLSIEEVGMVFPTKGGSFVALQSIDLKIARGEVVSLIGHSGCGKSTLLNIIAGLLEPSSGAVLLDGKAVEGPGPERAVVFQNHSLLPWLTV
ncbi:MAG TPA: ATP-binding cassette domain-containing protein, partial [Alphaproteobacteria bacterium]|nr:ATP-binding cassette domain-containing protein [Alphaproteobacteria bacterium]